MININKDDIKNFLIQTVAQLFASGVIAIFVVILSLKNINISSWTNFYGWLCKSTPIYNWILLLAFIISTCSVIQMIRTYLKIQKINMGIEHATFEIQRATKSLNEIIPLEKIEKEILLFFSKMENKSVCWFDIQINFNNMNETKLKHHIDTLSKKKYIGRSHSWDSFWICSDGRTYLVKNKLIS